jgi:hypothetical protein
MLKFLSQAEGRAIVGLGLSSENVRRLTEGKPIYLKLAEMKVTGPADEVEFLIYHGETEQALRDELKKAGLIGPDTVEQIDPRLG